MIESVPFPTVPFADSQLPVDALVRHAGDITLTARLSAAASRQGKLLDLFEQLCDDMRGQPNALRLRWLIDTRVQIWQALPEHLRPLFEQLGDAYLREMRVRIDAAFMAGMEIGTRTAGGAR